MTRIVLVGVITSIAFIVAILLLIRSRRLQERFAILWIVTAVGVVILGIWADGLDLLARAVGIAYPPSALFLLVSAFVVLVLLHTAVVLTRLSDQNQTLAQRVATLDERLRRLEGEAVGSEEDAGEPALRRAPQSAAVRRRLRIAREPRK
jgi:signal transduction histidine kinase